MASAMHMSAQVWPLWLPRAISRAEQKVLNIALSKQKRPPVAFSASFQSHLAQPFQSPLLANTSSTSSINPVTRSQKLGSNTQVRPLSLQISNSPQGRRPQIRQFSNTHTSPPPLQVCSTPLPTATTDTKPKWTPPLNVSSRPVAIIGAGVLGRRLATIWASTSRPVTLYDPSSAALTSASTYIADTLLTLCSSEGTHPGRVHTTSDLYDAVASAWLVIEAAPENLSLKISLLGRLDRICASDTIIATNSASFRSGELVSEVKGRERVCNSLYYIPPENRCVELMSDGYTAPELIPFLAEQMREIGLMPMVVGNESEGLIFPRIFGAMKREALKVLSEGVAKPEEIDMLFRDFFVAKKGVCQKMDEVGLDTVAQSERHWLAEERGERGDDVDGEGIFLGKRPEYLLWLEEEFVERGKLGEKSGEGLIVKGGIQVDEADLKKVLPGQVVWQEHAVDLSGL